jgi:3-hydroxyisobutyrate dehydrogenase-like beta-hydroxyacid dehydrogenase
MSKVAFLGLVAMGSRMAANLLKAGHTVTVWNRSPAAAEALVASGARKASSRDQRRANAGTDRCVTKGILFGGFPFVLTSWE